MTDERFWLLVSLKLSGEAPAEELAELETHLLQYPEKRFHADRINSMWQAKAKGVQTYKETAFNKHMQRLSNHFSEPVLLYESAETNNELSLENKKGSVLYKKLAWVTSIAASLLLIWFLIFDSPGSVKTDNSKAQTAISTSTKRGSKSQIQLPDGTVVWLNADSKISYNENFDGKIREVKLSGEAFFDVKRDETRPFVIHTNVIDIKVLGTAFNVRSYDDEKSTETSLIRGLVEVTLHSNPDTIYTLKPNDKLIVDNDQAGSLKPEINAGKKNDVKTEALPKIVKVKFEEKESSASETLWTKGKLAFDEEPLEEIALMLERWYDVKVNVDARIKKTKYSGVFEDEGLREVLEALHLSDRSFQYTYNKKEVNIRP